MKTPAPLAPKELVQQRLTICDACPAMKRLRGFRFCGTPFVPGRDTCGCCMDIKARLARTKCPRGKW